jgi:hypothetical protein
MKECKGCGRLTFAQCGRCGDSCCVSCMAKTSLFDLDCKDCRAEKAFLRDEDEEKRIKESISALHAVTSVIGTVTGSVASGLAGSVLKGKSDGVQT